MTKGLGERFQGSKREERQALFSTHFSYFHGPLFPLCRPLFPVLCVCRPHRAAGPGDEREAGGTRSARRLAAPDTLQAGSPSSHCWPSVLDGALLWGVPCVVRC